jgi:ribonuclease P protein component
VQRLKNRAQYEAAMAGGTVSRTPHFVLHRAGLGSEGAQALFAVRDEPWIGAVVPKRWAKRAVTRNAIKRQIYSLTASMSLPVAAHVVRLRSGFAKDEFKSAWSEPLKKVVRAELMSLFERASSVIPSQAGTQGVPS